MREEQKIYKILPQKINLPKIKNYFKFPCSIYFAKQCFAVPKPSVKKI